MNTHAEVSIQDKVLQAAKVLVSIPDFTSIYKNVIGADDPKAMDWSDEDTAQKWIWRRLESLGIYTDEDSNDILVSDDCQEGDARRYFCENGEPNLPVSRFKRVWSILKEAGSKSETDKPSETIPQSNLKDLVDAVRSAGQMSDDELLARYNLECADDTVEELSKRAHGRNFIVFTNKATGEIDVGLSRKFLKVARSKSTPAHIVIDDVFHQLYKSGQFPNAIFEECPLHPGVLLTMGYCDECQISWSSVQEKERIFIRVMCSEGDAPTSKFDIRRLVEEASGAEGIVNLKKSYPMVGMKFDELEEENRLPSLKIRSSEGDDEDGNVKDPFGNNERRF